MPVDKKVAGRVNRPANKKLSERNGEKGEKKRKEEAEEEEDDDDDDEEEKATPK